MDTVDISFIFIVIFVMLLPNTLSVCCITVQLLLSHHNKCVSFSQVNISELGLVTQAGKVIWGKVSPALYCFIVYPLTHSQLMLSYT